MKLNPFSPKRLILSVLFLFIFCQSGFSRHLTENPELDKKVKAFLSGKGYSWRNMNIPAADGQLLFNLIVKTGIKMLLK